MSKKVKILDHDSIRKKISRMAIQVHEEFFGEKELYIISVEGQGTSLAKRIHSELKKNSCFEKISLNNVLINKKKPWMPPVNFPFPEDIKNKNVLIVDDVLNTGKTLWHLFHSFHGIPIRKAKVLVLVNRNHLEFPVKPDITGFSLSTTLHHQVLSHLEDSNNMGVYLI